MSEQTVYFRIVGPKEEIYTFGQQVPEPVYAQESGEQWTLSFKSKDEKKDECFWYPKARQLAPHCQCYYFNDRHAWSNDLDRTYFDYDYVTHCYVGKRTPSRLWRAFSNNCAYTSRYEDVFMRNHLVFHSYWRAEELQRQLRLFLADESMKLPDLVDTFKDLNWHYRYCFDFKFTVCKVNYVISKKQQGYLLKDLNRHN